jgi:hypothetical protein
VYNAKLLSLLSFLSKQEPHVIYLDGKRSLFGEVVALGMLVAFRLNTRVTSTSRLQRSSSGFDPGIPHSLLRGGRNNNYVIKTNLRM